MDHKSNSLDSFVETESYVIAKALLVEDLEHGDSPQQALNKHLVRDAVDIAPWHSSPATIEACRAGMLRAALVFVLDHLGQFEDNDL